jgi:sec-independent protein translocase protein TatB
MFDIGYSELLIIAVVALIVIGPKDLPRVMRTIGHWVGRARGMARHFRSGIDTMMRESELEEMEKKWREENERIMREHPAAVGAWDSAALPPPGSDGETPPPFPMAAEPTEQEIGEQDARHTPPAAQVPATAEMPAAPEEKKL